MKSFRKLEYHQKGQSHSSPRHIPTYSFMKVPTLGNHAHKLPQGIDLAEN